MRFASQLRAPECYAHVRIVDNATNANSAVAAVFESTADNAPNANNAVAAVSASMIVCAVFANSAAVSVAGHSRF